MSREIGRSCTSLKLGRISQRSSKDFTKCCLDMLGSVLLMEEIRPTTWDVKNPAKNGINYQPQLVEPPDF